MQAVRQRARVSNGSLFHHFPTRRDLTAAVIAVGLDDHQRSLLSALGSDTEQSVTGAVRRHLDWVEDNPSLAQLLLCTPSDLLRASVSEQVLDSNRRFFDTVANWLTTHGWRQRPELHVLLALWIGPAQEFVRHWLATPDAGSLQDAAEGLAAGSWAAIRPWLTTPRAQTRKATR